MRNNQSRQLIIAGIALALYLVLAFAIPFPHTAVFWLAFAFTLIAVAAQVYVMKVAFNKGAPVRSRFYGYPIARIGVIYLAVQLIAGFAFMALGFAFRVPAWIAAVVFALILGLSAAGFLAADVMRDEVERQDAKIKTDVRAMRDLQGKVAYIAGVCDDAETKKTVSALAENFRYADPVSSEATREIEAGLIYAVDELQNAVVDGDLASAKTLCAKIEAGLSERNRICKLNK